MQELFLFTFKHAVDRNAGPARDHLRDVVGGHRLLDYRATPLAAFHRLQPLLDLRNAAIGNLAGALILAAALRIGEFDPQVVELVLELLGTGSFSFSDFQRAVRSADFFQRHELGFQTAEAGPRTGIDLLLQRLLLDLEADDLAIDRIEFFRLGIDLHLQPRRRLVDKVDRLVGQEPIGDVAI